MNLDKRSAMATELRYSQSAAVLGDALGVSHAISLDFPGGFAPMPMSGKVSAAGHALPEVDVVVMVDTVAEAQAMAAVMTPGHLATTWAPYTHKFDEYLPQIGPRGPAHQSHCLAKYMISEVGKRTVLCLHTSLHMHEDAIVNGHDVSLPIKDMLKQVIEETKCSLFLTTGTAGSVYETMPLGDVVVSRAARFACRKDFAQQPYNNTTFKSDWIVPGRYAKQAAEMMRTLQDRLAGGTPPDKHCGVESKPLSTRIHFDGMTIPAFHPVLTTDYFEVGTSVNRLDRLGACVEMDDACLGLACSELKKPPCWACVRNCSDPCLNGKLDDHLIDKCAEFYYKRFGYWTSINSAIVTWSIIAGC